MNFFAKSRGQRGELYLYEAIGEGFFGGITAKTFSDSISGLGDVQALDIYINSPGGSVFDGVAIYNQIKRHKCQEKVVHIDGIAASIASVIAMAGTEIRIADNGMMMIHDPWGMSVGTAADMRKTAESLDKVRAVILDTYVSASGGNPEEISQWMEEETWMTADEAIGRGFASKKSGEKMLNSAFPMLNKFNKVPEQLMKQVSNEDMKIARMNMRVSQLNLRSPRR